MIIASHAIRSSSSSMSGGFGEQFAGSRATLYAAYTTFCHENGRKHVASTEFGKRLRTMGVTGWRETGGRRRGMYNGIVRAPV